MAFFKLRARNPQGNDSRSVASAPPAESVEGMRRRARHRLLGAAVLVLLGVIGFPLLFDTQPRPVAVDIPIDIPDRTKAKPLPVPGASSSTTAAAPGGATGAEPRVASAASAKPALPATGGMITEGSDGEEIAPSRPVSDAPPGTAARAEARAESRPDVRPEKKPELKPESKPERVAEAKPEPKPPVTRPTMPANDGARARALLEGKSPETIVAAASQAPAAPGAAATAADDGKGRFVVQVGAFADAEKARETRLKLERAGLKTYTHVAKTADGERTRVRVGPFGSKAEADRAAGRIKGLALPAAVLTL